MKFPTSMDSLRKVLKITTFQFSKGWETDKVADNQKNFFPQVIPICKLSQKNFQTTESILKPS